MSTGCEYDECLHELQVHMFVGYIISRTCFITRMLHFFLAFPVTRQRELALKLSCIQFCSALRLDLLGAVVM